MGECMGITSTNIATYIASYTIYKLKLLRKCNLCIYCSYTVCNMLQPSYM